MNYEYSYEKMRMWTDIRHYVKNVYKVTKTFPYDEKYCLNRRLIYEYSNCR